MLNRTFIDGEGDKQGKDVAGVSKPYGMKLGTMNDSPAPSPLGLPYSQTRVGVRVVIVGTGTEIGKTHVTACLLAQARAQGKDVRGYKPIATGIQDLCEDAQLHAEALGAPYLHPSFSYRRPVSPHLAAREEGRAIDLEVVRRKSDELAQGRDAVVIESAGGLFTPLGEALTNVALVRCLMPAAVVLVAPDRLGVLHDVGACVTAARACGIEFSALVLSAPAVPDASTGSNALELNREGMPAVVGVFPRASWHTQESQGVAATVWKALGASPATQMSTNTHER
jgi:dethiobiotin synthetase